MWSSGKSAPASQEQVSSFHGGEAPAYHFDWVPEHRNLAANVAWRRANADVQCLAPVVELLVRISRDRVAARLVVALIVGVAVALVVGATARWGFVMAGWISAAAVYVGWTWIVVLGMDAERTAAYATRQDPTSAVSSAIVWFASVASLGGVGYLLIAESSSGRRAVVATGVGVLSVVASWIMVHTLAMLRYARLYYSDKRGGIDFNQEDPPCYIDFAYVAFTIGMAYQVSDTAIQTTPIRATALRQALVSYLFGAVILAATVNLVAGLGGK